MPQDLSHLYKRPVTQTEILTALARAEDLDPAIAYTFRLLAFQFFREQEPLAEWADSELAMIYADDFNEEIPEVETVYASSDFMHGPTPNQTEHYSAQTCSLDDKSIIRRPLSIACKEEETASPRVHGAPGSDE